MVLCIGLDLKWEKLEVAFSMPSGFTIQELDQCDGQMYISRMNASFDVWYFLSFANGLLCSTLLKKICYLLNELRMTLNLKLDEAGPQNTGLGDMVSYLLGSISE